MNQDYFESEADLYWTDKIQSYWSLIAASCISLALLGFSVVSALAV